MGIATARFEARLTPEIHNLLKRAAELEGRTLKDFIISAAQKAAEETLMTQHVLQLSLDDQRIFAQALLEPPAPNAALGKAIERYQQLVDKIDS